MICISDDAVAKVLLGYELIRRKVVQKILKKIPFISRELASSSNALIVLLFFQ